MCRSRNRGGPWTLEGSSTDGATHKEESGALIVATCNWEAAIGSAAAGWESATGVTEAAGYVAGAETDGGEAATALGQETSFKGFS